MAIERIEEEKIDPETVRAELTSVLASPMFRGAERTSELLRFVVDTALKNESGQLKETFIAVSIFGRDASYDPKLDPIVRVQAGRVRNKLVSYYEGPGSTSTLRISLPKGSYRPQFIPTSAPAALFGDSSNHPSAEAHSFVALQREASAPPIPKKSIRWIWFAILCGMVLLAFAGLRWSFPRSTQPLPAVPVATASGHNMQASFSPDGQRFVYAWTDGKSAANLYIANIDGHNRTRLTTDESHDLRPAWSPDGRDIAFLRVGRDQTDIVIKALYGQSETVLGTLRTPINPWSSDPAHITYAPGPAWTQSGRSIVVTDNPDGKGYGLYEWSLDSGLKRQLTAPGNGAEDIFPALSPDGKNLAFVRYTSGGAADVYAGQLGKMNSTRITFDDRDVEGLVWTPDGKSIIFSSFRSGEHRLWKTSLTGGNEIPIAVNGRDQTEPALSSNGRSLLFTESDVNTSIWEIPINGNAGSLQTQIIDSTRSNDSPQYSPDGQSIVFESYRSGERQLWITAKDGSNPTQLTHLSNVPLGGPRWSPDGRQITFYALVGQHKQIFLVDVKTGESQQLITSKFEDRSPNWSANGKSLYFNSDRDGIPGCWGFDLANKALSKIAQRVCWDNFESPDGKILYFVTTEPGIWQVDLATMKETVVPSLQSARPKRYIAMTPHGIYFIDSEGSGNNLSFFDGSTRVTKVVAHIEGKLAPWEAGLSISPDGQRALFTLEDKSASEIDLLRQP